MPGDQRGKDSGDCRSSRGYRLDARLKATSHNGISSPMALGDALRIMRPFAFRAAAPLAEAARSQPLPSKPRLTRCLAPRSSIRCPANAFGQPSIGAVRRFARRSHRRMRLRVGRAGGVTLPAEASANETPAQSVAIARPRQRYGAMTKTATPAEDTPVSLRTKSARTIGSRSLRAQKRLGVQTPTPSGLRPSSSGTSRLRIQEPHRSRRSDSTLLDPLWP